MKSTIIHILPAVPTTEAIGDPLILARRDAIVAKCRAGTVIKTSAGLSKVGLLLKEIRDYLKEVEEAAAEVSLPVMNILNQIHEQKRILIGDVTGEKDRLTRLAGEFKAEQDRIEKEAAQKRQAELLELQRAQREKEEADRRAALEAERLKAEAERKAREVKAAPAKEVDFDPSGSVSLEDLQDAEPPVDPEVQAAKDREEEERLNRMKILMEADKAAAAKKAAAGLEGMHVRKSIEFEVIDIEALYEANPSCVKLTPVKSVIQAALKQLKPGQHLPGVTHREVAKTVVR